MIESEVDEIFDELKKIIKSKNIDYNDSFHDTFMEYGLESSYIRLTDKLNRLKYLAKHDAKVKDEKVIDTLYDLTNYCVLTLLETKKLNHNGIKKW